jgi:template-activating factor I
MSQKRSFNDEIKPVELSSEQLATLDDIEREQMRLTVIDEFQTHQRFAPYYEKRREKLKKIPQFWFGALQNDVLLMGMHGNHPEDLDALKYLEDVWVVRHKPDPRAFTLEMVRLLVFISFGGHSSLFARLAFQR